MSLTFLTPWLLAGGVLIAVPIIIHLILRKKPKHLLFPAFRFLQQKHRTYVQKLRLRHILLLAMRILLILLICWALARPEVSGESSILGAEAPVAVVLVFDTSPSMEYEHEGKTRLDLAREHALRFLEQLPTSSQVAIFDTRVSDSADDEEEPRTTEQPRPGAEFKPVGDAIKQVQKLRIRPNNRPVTASLEEAYGLLQRQAPRLPVLMCVFSDRTAASWNADLTRRDLIPLHKKVTDKLAQPLAGLYVDLSAPSPRNVAIAGLSLKQRGGAEAPLERLEHGVSPLEPVQLLAAVKITGTSVDSELSLVIDGNAVETKRLNRQAKPGAEETVIVPFTPIQIQGGDARQGEIRLKNRDALNIDNVRYWSLAASQRRVLVIADRKTEAHTWCLALENAPLPMTCEVVEPKDVPLQLSPADYQAVCLMNLAKPGEQLWKTLREYVVAGGGVVVLPGEASDSPFYNTEAAKQVLPAQLVGEPQKSKTGAFLDLANSEHALVKRILGWQAENLEYWRAERFWKLQLNPGTGRIIVNYHGGGPALMDLDPQAKLRGQVILFTTAMYDTSNKWNNYLQGWFYPALAYVATAHVMEARREQQNFLLGEDVRFWLPPGPGFDAYGLTGPAGGKGEVKPGQQQLAVFDVKREEGVRPETIRPGNYRVSDRDGKRWHRHFSLNLDPEESHLVSGRPEPDAIAALLGDGSYYPYQQVGNFAELARSRLGQTPKSELLPYLMIGVLLLLAGENFLANRFYRREAE